MRPGDAAWAEITVEGKRDTSDGARGVLTVRTDVYNQNDVVALQFQTTLLMKKGAM